MSRDECLRPDATGAAAAGVKSVLPLLSPYTAATADVDDGDGTAATRTFGTCGGASLSDPPLRRFGPHL